ncbi:phage major capsid protein [Fructobacillus sp. CRL 2054]|uniref:phage major capsid protein n=1 Tax=Fructobacillus sp. CRL 2054 TaxID=2763007 RepID=UPI002379B327|nr:phage major capsid protein [Fructobacillus sp. CRL 2054]MDD9139143.1 phage major capsid protein [Fructobacillus sp. CRL 2054]
MNLNELQKVYADAGNKVSDLRSEMQAMAVNDDVTVEQIQAKKAEVENAVAKRDLAEENLDAFTDEMATQAVKADVKPLTKSEEKKKATFIDDFKKMVMGDMSFKNSVNSTTDDSGVNAGLTIPKDIQTTINKLVRQYDSLQELVRVEHVGTTNGQRVYEKWSDVTPLVNLDAEDGEIGEIDEPKLTLVKYLIKRYAGIQTVTNSLLKDTAENIMGWLTGWVAKKVVVTRNAEILKVMASPDHSVDVAKFDDLHDLINELDPALKATAKFVVNQSGFNTLSKVKTGTGQYLIQKDVTQGAVDTILGFPVKVVSDKWMPTLENGKNIIYFGDFTQAITLFDRENMSIATTNVGGNSFTTDTTKLRVIDRFDVQPTDGDAYIAGGFTKIADQVFNLPKQTADASK